MKDYLFKGNKSLLNFFLFFNFKKKIKKKKKYEKIKRFKNIYIYIYKI